MKYNSEVIRKVWGVEITDRPCTVKSCGNVGYEAKEDMWSPDYDNADMYCSGHFYALFRIEPFLMWDEALGNYGDLRLMTEGELKPFKRCPEYYQATWLRLAIKMGWKSYDWKPSGD